jgi:CubicO group peptidase (beta-lactamase class C family)
MRLGLEWNEWDPDYSEPDNQLLTFYDEHTDYTKALLDLPMAAEPGSTFAYNTVASVSLGQAIENRAPLSLIDYGGAFLLAPLGISNIEVFLTPTGLPDLGRGLFLTTRDMLKFGQLYMDGGLWNGERLVSSDWVSASLTPYTAIGWSEGEPMGWEIEGYGYQWWLGYFDIEGRRLDTFAAWGHGEQWIMAIPELQLVVAINSHAWEGGRAETNQVFDLMRRFIIPAVER